MYIVLYFLSDFFPIMVGCLKARGTTNWESLLQESSSSKTDIVLELCLCSRTIPYAEQSVFFVFAADCTN